MCYYFDWGDGSSGLEKKNCTFFKKSALFLSKTHMATVLMGTSPSWTATTTRTVTHGLTLSSRSPTALETSTHQMSMDMIHRK